jgi:hypothetical protein
MAESILSETYYRAMFTRMIAHLATVDDHACDTIIDLAGNAVSGGTAPGKLAKAIVDANVADLNRKTAQVIGLTATGIIYNVSSLRGYQASGRVTHVHVMDGCPECTDAANAVWTIERAFAEPLGRAGCVRAFSVVVGDELRR